MPFCGECGAKTTSLKFCGECGAKISSTATSVSRPTAGTSSPAKTSLPGDVRCKFTVTRSTKDLTCMECSKQFTGKHLKINGKTYHPNCLECFKCSQDIINRCSDDKVFILRDGKPWCFQCIEWARKNKEQSKVVKPTFNQKKVSFKNKDKPCSKCKKKIGPYDMRDAVELKNGLLHKKCALCTTCGNKLDAVLGFTETPDGLYHSNCAPKLENICAECGKNVVGAFVKKKNKKWHRNCFICAECKTSLKGVGSMEKDGKTLCRSCLKKAYKNNVVIRRANEKATKQNITVGAKTN